MAEGNDRKEILIGQLDRARSRITAHRQALAEDFTAPAKLKGQVKSNFRRHRFTWLGATALIGLVLAKIPPRTKKVIVSPRRGKRDAEIAKVEKAGILAAALKFAFDLAKPFLLRFGKTLLEQALERRKSRQAGSPAWSRM